MGRKRREIDSFIAEWPDIENVEDNLICKYCKVKLPLQQNRLYEHVNSKKHMSMKNTFQNVPSLPNILFRDKQCSDIEKDLVSVIVFDGLPLSLIDKKSSLREFLSRYCWSSRSLPDSRALVDKYLPIIFQQNEDNVKSILKNKRFTLIIDETPDFRNRPLLNILASFYDTEECGRRILMLDSKILTECNSVIIANEVSETLQRYGLNWKCCMAIVSDCAPYMKKYYKNLSVMHNHIMRVPCFSHMIHLAIRKAIETVFGDIKQFCMKFSALLCKNRSAKNLFLQMLRKNGIEFEKEIPRVLDIRWYSMYNCIQCCDQYFPAVLGFFLESKHESISKFRNIVDISKESLDELHIYLRFISTSLSPLYDFSTSIESKDLYGISYLYEWMESNYNISETDILNNYKSSIAVFPFDRREEIFGKMTKFVNILVHQMSGIINKQTKDCFPSCDFLKTVRNLDFTQMCNINDVKLSDISLHVELTERENLQGEYLTFPRSERGNVSDLESFWKKIAHVYPVISKISKDLTAIPLSSISVERSFSKVKHMLTQSRTRLSNDRCRMLSLLYYNGKL